MAGVTTTVRGPAKTAAPDLAVAARKYVVEVIGTFFLMSAFGMATLTGSPLVPLAAGVSACEHFFMEEVAALAPR